MNESHGRCVMIHNRTLLVQIPRYRRSTGTEAREKKFGHKETRVPAVAVPVHALEEMSLEINARQNDIDDNATLTKHDGRRQL